MTSTAPALPSDIEWVDVPLAELEAEAEKIATERGESAAEWLEIGWESTARRILRLIEDGDPVADEYGPGPALVTHPDTMDDLTEDGLLGDVLELDLGSVTAGERAVIVEAFTQRFYQAYWDRVSVRCGEYL